MAIALRTSNRAISALPNVPKFFNRYSLPIGFGLLNNPFGDHMIGVFLETGLLTRQFLEMPLGAFRATLLQALTQGMHTLSILLDNFTAEGLAFAIGSKVDDTQVNSEGIRGFIGRRGRNIKGDCQVECPVAVEHISLPFNGIHPRLLIASHPEGNEHATRERQEGYSIQPLKGHHPLVIHDSPLWSE